MRYYILDILYQSPNDSFGPAAYSRRHGRDLPRLCTGATLRRGRGRLDLRGGACVLAVTCGEPVGNPLDLGIFGQ